MGFVEAIQSGFRNYVGFSGRAARSEYWYWALFYFIVGIVANVLDFSMGGGGGGVGVFSIIVGLVFLLPSLAMAFRRIHDRDKSAWFLLLGLIPLVGAIILIVWFCSEGNGRPEPVRAGPARRNDVTPT